MTLKDFKDQIIITKKIEYEEIIASFNPDGMCLREQKYYRRNRIPNNAQWYEAKVSNDLIA